MWSAIQACDGQRFAWGKLDCCLFAAKVVDAMTGRDFTGALQQRYGDKRGAVRFLREEGGLSDAVTAYLGEPAPGRALRGDVVLFDSPNGDCLGICVGGSIAAISSAGLLYLPLNHQIRRWAI